MATRSAIGYIRPDGSICAVYCHWDGSPSHHLPILTEHYNSLRKVQALIRPGSMSQLHTTQLWESEYDPETRTYSPSRSPQPLYHHERGDANSPREHNTLPEARWYWGACGVEHIYIFSPENGWIHYSP